MKAKALSTLLISALVLSTFLLFLPTPTWAEADERITLDPEFGPIDEEVELDGRNFDPDEEQVDIYFSKDDADVGDRIDDEVDTYMQLGTGIDIDSNEEFEFTFDVPAEMYDGPEDEDVYAGRHFIHITYGDERYIIASTPFTVEGIIELQPWQAPVEYEIEVEGSGYEPRQYVDISFARLEVDVGDDIDSTGDKTEVVSGARIDGDGELEDVEFFVPETLDGYEVIPGEYWIYVTYQSDYIIIAEHRFVVGEAIEAQLELNPNRGVVGTRVEVEGTAFIEYADLRISFSDTLDLSGNWEKVESLHADISGNFNISFRVPGDLGRDVDVEAGSYYVLAIDAETKEVLASVLFDVIEYEIQISATSGDVGDRVEVEGFGFDAYEDEELETWFCDEDGRNLDDLSHCERVKRKSKVNRDGELKAQFDVPERLPGEDISKKVRKGTYYIHIADPDTDDIIATARFDVGRLLFDLYPNDGEVGTRVEVFGLDFAAKKTVTIYYDDARIGARRVDPDGEFTFTFDIPPSSAGKHIVSAVDSDYTEAEAIFEVVPSFTMNSLKVASSPRVEVEGIGFDSHAVVIISVDEEEVAEVETDATGYFSGEYVLPGVDVGNHIITARDAEGNKAEDSFIITCVVRVSPDEVSPGGEVTVAGSGFTAGQNVTISYDGSEVATAKSDPDGCFKMAITVPENQGNTHIIVVTDIAGNRAQAEVVLESSASLTPCLISPPPAQRLGLFGGQQPSLDWSDTSDPSGMSYSVQLASSADFSRLVLVKMDLTDSQYTLSQIEALKPGSYYWRVQAIDGAGNESGWSSPSQFRVGAFPAWLSLGVFIALIVVVLAIISGFIYVVLRRIAV